LLARLFIQHKTSKLNVKSIRFYYNGIKSAPQQQQHCLDGEHKGGGKNFSNTKKISTEDFI
jgi:hypothetical protein